MAKAEKPVLAGRKFLAVLLALAVIAAVILVPTVSAYARDKDSQKLRIATISDTHILAPELIKNTKDFQADNSVGKMFDESLGILDAQLEQVKKEKADVLLIAGDLTKDGELESHRALAKRLKEFKKEMPNLKIYLINGNHDINNKNAKNYNTPDGKAVSATRTTPKDFYKTYKDLVYEDPTVIALYTPKDGANAGQESYVARPAKGYTLIAIDSCRYSSDNSGSGKDEHNTSGQITKDLENWVLEQAAAARKRGDTILCMEHHNIIPHFTFEDVTAVDYVIHDWKRLSQEYADNGMKYFFTGHYHAQDVAKLTTDKHNDLYDIETGSAGGYPSPMRIIDFQRSWDKDGKRTEKVDGKTIEHLKVKYTSSLDGKEKTIDDLTSYGSVLYGGLTGINTHMINENIYGYVLRTVEDWLDERGISITKAEEDAIYKWIDDACLVKVSSDGHSALDLINYCYSRHTGGTDNGALDSWFTEGVKNVESGKVVTDFVDQLLDGAPAVGQAFISQMLGGIFPADAMSKIGVNTQTDIIRPLLQGQPLTKDVTGKIGAFLASWAMSLAEDANYPDDLTFHTEQKQQADGGVNDGRPAPYPGHTSNDDLTNTVEKVMLKIGDYV